MGIPGPRVIPAPGRTAGGAVASSIVKPLSGSGVPADALGVLGQTYYNTITGKWYLKRWVGNCNNDSVIVNSPFIGGNEDWSCSFLFKAATGKNNQRFVSQGNGGFISGEYNIDQMNTTPGLRFGATYGFSLIFDNILDGVTWHKLEADRVNGIHSATVDGVTQTDVKIRTLLVPTFLACGVGTGGGTSICMIADFVGNRGSNRVSLPFDEGSGAIAYDRTGNGNNGIISDGSPYTFWTQTWVPIL